jgi:hypothetical protein
MRARVYAIAGLLVLALSGCATARPGGVSKPMRGVWAKPVWAEMTYEWPEPIKIVGPGLF